VIVTGFFAGAVNFGDQDLTSAGSNDVFVAKFGDTPSGTVWTPESRLFSISVYPNPFNPATTIRYTLPSKGRVTIGIYDARGARVATLIDQEQPAGPYTIPWGGRSDAGSATSSGVYFARIEFSGETRASKMVLLK
jgi:hypothetical protein